MPTFKLNQPRTTSTKLALAIFSTAALLAGTTHGLPAATGAAATTVQAPLPGGGGEECVGLCQRYRGSTIGLGVALGLVCLVALVSVVGPWCCYIVVARWWEKNA